MIAVAEGLFWNNISPPLTIDIVDVAVFLFVIDIVSPFITIAAVLKPEIVEAEILILPAFNDDPALIAPLVLISKFIPVILTYLVSAEFLKDNNVPPNDGLFIIKLTVLAFAEAAKFIIGLTVDEPNVS